MSHFILPPNIIKARTEINEDQPQAKYQRCQLHLLHSQYCVLQFADLDLALANEYLDKHRTESPRLKQSGFASVCLLVLRQEKQMPKTDGLIHHFTRQNMFENTATSMVT